MSLFFTCWLRLATSVYGVGMIRQKSEGRFNVLIFSFSRPRGYKKGKDVKTPSLNRTTLNHAVNDVAMLKLTRQGQLKNLKKETH